MPAPKRADRSSVKDTWVSVRIPSNRLAALDAAVARTAQRMKREVSRTEFMLTAVFRAVEEEGVSLDDPVVTLTLPFVDSGTLSLPFAAPAPAPPSPPVASAAAVEPASPVPARKKKRRRRSNPSMKGVDVVHLPPRPPPRPR
jgi:hypothetical protein